MEGNNNILRPGNTSANGRQEIVGIKPTISEVNLGTCLSGVALTLRTDKLPLDFAYALQIWFDVLTEDFAGGESITLKLWHYNPKLDDYCQVGSDFTLTTPAVTKGTSGVVSVTDTSNEVLHATHFSVSSSALTVVSGGKVEVYAKKLGLVG